MMRDEDRSKPADAPPGGGKAARTFRRLLRSPIANTWAGQLVSPLRFLILTPILLRTLSEVEAAVFFSIATTDVVGNLIAGRIRRPATQILSNLYSGASSFDTTGAREQAKRGELLGTPNWPRFRQALAAFGRIQGIAGFIGAILGTLITALAVGGLTGWKLGDGGYLAVVLLSGLNVFYKMLMNRYLAVLHAVRRVPVTARIRTVGSLVGLVSGSVVLLAGGGLVGLVLSEVLVQMATRSSLRVWANRLVPEIRDLDRSDTGALPEYWAAVKQPVGRGFASALMSAGVSRLAILMFASESNAGLLASYFLARRFLDQVGNLGDLAIQSKLPCFTKAFLGEETVSLRREVGKVLLLTVGVLVAGVLVVGWFAPPFLTFIKSNVLWLDRVDWLLLASLFVVTRIGNQLETLYQLTNEFPFFRRDFIAGVAVLVLMPFAVATGDVTWVILVLMAPYPLAKELLPLRKVMSLVRPSRPVAA